MVLGKKRSESTTGGATKRTAGKEEKNAPEGLMKRSSCHLTCEKKRGRENGNVTRNTSEGTAL